ncbi:hypothetical protein ACRWHO_17280, partial [Escherichia coli]
MPEQVITKALCIYQGQQINLAYIRLRHFEFTNGRIISDFKEGANKRGNSSRLTQSFHFFMFEPIFSPVNALN